MSCGGNCGCNHSQRQNPGLGASVEPWCPPACPEDYLLGQVIPAVNFPADRSQPVLSLLPGAAPAQARTTGAQLALLAGFAPGMGGYGTAPDLAGMAVANGRSAQFGSYGLGSPLADLEAVEAARVPVQTINAMPNPPEGCGRLPGKPAELQRNRTLCYQRAVLVAVGFLAEDRYGAPPIGSGRGLGQVGGAAIARLQRALGFVGADVDEDWGPTTNRRLSEVIGVQMTSTAKGRAGAGPPSPRPPQPGPTPPEKAKTKGGGGLGVLAVLAGAAALVAAGQGS